MNPQEPLVTPEWLRDHLDQVVVLDATYFLPADAAQARRCFDEAHIPTARFFDIDAIADTGSPLPHMLPLPEAFAKAVGALGVGDGDRIVVYDRSRNHFSAPRVWWTFRVFGHDSVAVLDGGLLGWQALGLPVANGPEDPEPRAYRPGPFRADLVASLEDVRRIVDGRPGRRQILDARAQGRFDGTAPEPRPGLRAGHMPGSLNLPFDQLTAEDGRFIDAAAIEARLAAAGLSAAEPVVTTCGSGLTASVLALALHRAGRSDVAVYDGSWTEWGGRADTPVERSSPH